MNSGMNAKTRESDEYETPPELYALLNGVYRFTLDPCATAKTAKCARYFTKRDDGLEQDWANERVFVNPPYSDIYNWVLKGRAAAAGGALVVMLLPVRTDSDWFCEEVLPRANEILWLRRRVRFLLGGKRMTSPRFASLVVVFKPGLVGELTMGVL